MPGRPGGCPKVPPAISAPPTERARVPQLLLTILLIAIGWFLLIRPQQARVRDQRAMVATLQEGDRVITAGGIHGRITGLATETVEVEVSPKGKWAALTTQVAPEKAPAVEPDALRTDRPGTSARPSARRRASAWSWCRRST